MAEHGRLIDADAMMNRLKEWDTDDHMDKALYNFAVNRIIEQPTIEPERENGEWVVLPDGRLSCSNCCSVPTNRIIINGNLVYDMTPIREKMKFCPNCGSYNGVDMRQEGERMNHDYAHCFDCTIDCPQDCFRAQLVRDLKRFPSLPVSWASLKGTDCCPMQKEGGQNE